MPCPTVRATRNHEQLRLELMAAGSRLLTAGEGFAFLAAREDLATFCLDAVMAHLDEDESWLAEADACTEARLLARAMRAENRAMTAAVDELARATTPCEAMAEVRVLHTLLAAHAHHETLLVEAIRATTGA